jgi:hypothetical protein
MTEKNGEGEATISGLVIACIDEGDRRPGGGASR